MEIRKAIKVTFAAVGLAAIAASQAMAGIGNGNSFDGTCEIAQGDYAQNHCNTGSGQNHPASVQANFITNRNDPTNVFTQGMFNYGASSGTSAFATLYCNDGTKQGVALSTTPTNFFCPAWTHSQVSYCGTNAACQTR